MQNKILQYEIAVEEQKALKPKDSQAEQMQKMISSLLASQVQ